jgi:hypothetical protein
LGIFAGVLFLSFAALSVMIFKTDTAQFEKVSDLLKFIITSVVPLVTLAVGYYLGDSNRRAK